MPGTKPAPELSQKSLNAYPRHLSALKSGVRKNDSFPLLDGLQLICRLTVLPAGKGWLGVPGRPTPTAGGAVHVSRQPGHSEAEEVFLLGAAAVRRVPVDRREALGVMDVLCGQSSVQDLRVRPRLGEPGRQSCVSRGPGKGPAGA